MQILYTGTPTPAGQQTDPLKSLGGFVSSTPIPNGSMNAIFPPISRDHIKKRTTDVRLIVLKNETGSAITGITVYSTRGDYSSYLMAAVTPGHNTKLNCDEYELIVNGHSLPYQAVLTSCEGSDNAIAIASLAAGASIGLWIQRVVDISEFNELDGKPSTTSLTNDEIIALLQAEEAGLRVDQGAIKINW
jgi:hypothetical protein